MCESDKMLKVLSKMKERIERTKRRIYNETRT